MQLPHSTASSETYLEYTDFMEGAFDAWQDAEIITDDQKQVVAEVKASITDASNALREKKAAREALDKEVQKAEARFTARDKILDLRVNQTKAGVFNGPALRNREHDYIKLLERDMPTHKLTRLERRTQVDKVDAFLARFDQLPEFEGKALLRKNLSDALDESKKARQDLDDKESLQKRAFDEEVIARNALRVEIDDAFKKLGLAFKGMRDFTESFFPQVGAPRTTPTRAEIKGWTGALLEILQSKNLSPDEELRKKINKNNDLDLLKTWLRKALTATALTEIFPPEEEKKTS